MIMRNLNQLAEYLDGELAWRKKELTTLKLRLDNSRAHERGVLTRAALCLLYAHWEGFVRVAAMGYVDYIVRQGVHLGNLTPNFVALALSTEMERACNSNKSTMHTALVMRLRSDLSEPFRVNPQRSIQTGANLKTDVLREILSVTGIDPTDYIGKRVIIDRLVDQRNLVAHGVHGEGFEIALDDYENLHQDVIGLVEMFRTDVENAAALSRFLVT